VVVEDKSSREPHFLVSDSVERRVNVAKALCRMHGPLANNSYGCRGRCTTRLRSAKVTFSEYFASDILG
jgi:hypothetical protein